MINDMIMSLMISYVETGCVTVKRMTGRGDTRRVEGFQGSHVETREEFMWCEVTEGYRCVEEK